VINFGLRRSSVLYLIKHGVACERFNFKWLKNDPSEEFIGVVILKINVVQAEKIKAKVYVNEHDF
jgi:hypothetical protein